MLLSDRSEPLPLEFNLLLNGTRCATLRIDQSIALGFMRVSQNVKTFLSTALSARAVYRADRPNTGRYLALLLVLGNKASTVQFMNRYSLFLVFFAYTPLFLIQILVVVQCGLRVMVEFLIRPCTVCILLNSYL